MKKKVWACLLIVTIGVSMMGCGDKKELSATARGPETADGKVYIDEEAVAMVGSVATATMTDDQKARVAELKAMATAAFDLVNKQRTAAGLPALVWSTDLESCSLVRATEIATKFSHTRPNETDWWTVNSNIMWGENLAKGYNTADSLVQAWMNSPTHAANVLGKDYKTGSIAIYEVNGALYCAQEFGY